MDDRILGLIKLWGGDIPPDGWDFCQGQIVEINSNVALFQLIGTLYGGNGRSTFAYPKLSDKGRARFIMCVNGRVPERK